ncbi:hypothetical protein [Paenibacillus pseudetheri]|uniref:Uncharacterized protein n=1 Tax=Paenibacillus pseudetheri TaxID=2897682 RepID=A0ABM9BGN3_9BACL|nr:hypothetical protein [Paenibacillus pseudetheri]CAH1057987.1 hypothetical protein PAECIP111894_04160 [Paenibacillus pseudetheri]
MFHEDTKNNIVYRTDNVNYYLTIIDDGMNKSISHLLLHNSQLLNRYSIKTDTFDPDKYMGGFKDLVKTADAKGLKPVDYAVRVVLETEFFDDPKNKMFEMLCTRKLGLGLAVMYKVYDANFNDVSVAWNTANQSFYFTTTSETAINNKTEGSYTKPFTQTGNTTVGSNGI